MSKEEKNKKAQEAFEAAMKAVDDFKRDRYLGFATREQAEEVKRLIAYAEELNNSII